LFFQFSQISSIINMVSKRLETREIITVKPEGSFVNSIEIGDANDVQVTLKGNPSTYHYKLESNLPIVNLVEIDSNGGSVGRWYNENLRGKSVARTRVTVA